MYSHLSSPTASTERAELEANPSPLPPQDLDSFDASGDADNMVVMGSFRGKLTFPTADGADPVTLENPKWQKYDGFLTKFNVNTHKVVWATGEKIQRPTCNNNTDTTMPDRSCKEPTSVGGSVSTTSEGHALQHADKCHICIRNLMWRGV